MTDTSVGESNDSAVSPTPSPYEMTVDLNVIEHLGINLYSNIAAVLTEAVANAWDADAEQVEIEVDPNQKWIAISDDGVGMSVADINDKYLRVGYRRRDDGNEGSVTAKNRPVMGRKGLGKLSLFSIANVIDVQSAKNGEAHGLRMTVKGIRESLERGDRAYRPDPLPREEIEVTKGTRIVLKEIKRTRLTPGVAALRKRLARRFSIIGELHRFRVAIDGEPNHRCGPWRSVHCTVSVDVRRLRAPIIGDTEGGRKRTPPRPLSRLGRELDGGWMAGHRPQTEAVGQQGSRQSQWHRRLRERDDSFTRTSSTK